MSSYVYTCIHYARALQYNNNNYSQLSMNYSEQLWEICTYADTSNTIQEIGDSEMCRYNAIAGTSRAHCIY